MAVVGAGPAGLTAAHTLMEAGVRVTLLERNPRPGGLGGTTVFEGKAGTYRFDYGGHRFITRNAELIRLVDALLGDDLLTAERHSVIRLGGRTYDYPLSIGNLLANAPASLIAGAALDLSARLVRGRTPPEGADFATWTRARFGPTLYRAFFEGYTRKLWGIPPEELSGDWAEQRISLLDLRDVARRLLPGAGSGLRTYARSYRYPSLGFGLIFDRLAARLARMGAAIHSGVTVTGFAHQDGRVEKVLTDQGPLACDAVISTLPLPDLVRLTGGQSSLRFRGLRFLNLTVDAADVSPWTWQYLSDPHILATRLQEPRRRSPHMAPPGRTSLMLEIPCDPGDALWTMADRDLLAIARRDLSSLGVDVARLTGECFSTRAPCAYPLMHVGYERAREAAFRHLQPFRNLVPCGRQGAFRYVFTDTAMEMGQMAARSLLAGEDLRPLVRDHRNERVVIEAQSIA